MLKKVSKVGGSKPTQTKTITKKSSGSSKQTQVKTTTKSSGSSKVSNTNTVKQTTPAPKPKNVDKVEFGKPKQTASAGTYKPAPPKPSAHSSASKTFTATHSKPFTAPQPETVTFKVKSSYNEGITMQFVDQGDKMHLSAPPKDAVKECCKTLHYSNAVERDRIKTQAQMVILPNAISQANKAYDNLCKAADEYFQVANEVVDKTQDIPDRLEGDATLRDKWDMVGYPSIGAAFEIAREAFMCSEISATGVGVAAALGEALRRVQNFYIKVRDVGIDLVEGTEALERVTKNLNKAAEQFNIKNQEVFDAIEEAGGKMDGQTIEYPLKSEQIARTFQIHIW